MTKIQYNDEQQKAVDFHKGACSVIAAAGSGKSTVLLGRIDNLIKKHNISEKDILAISFTRNTADELTNSLKEKGYHHVNVGTFHSICGQILQKEGIYVNNMIQEWQAENCFKAIDQEVDTKDVLSFIGYQKNYMRTPEDSFIEKDSEYSEESLRKFYRAYEDYKNKNKLYDFEDYLILCLEMLRKNPRKYTYEYILVDEHQDSNLIQNELLKEWCQSGNIFVLSDFRQAIYSFRSGNVEYSMNFDKYWDNATVLNISKNYRSPKNIVGKSNQFIRNYYEDYEHYKDAIAHNQEDGHIEINSFSNRIEEATYVGSKVAELIEKGTPLNEISIIYRMNKHGDFIENELRRREIDYEIANDGSFFKRKEIAGVLAFLRLIVDENDDSAFETAFRLRTYPLMYFSNAIYRNIQEYAQENGESVYNSLMYVRFPQNWQRQNARIFQSGVERLRDLYDSGANTIRLIDEIVKLYRIEQTIKESYTNKDEREERLESIEVLKIFAKNYNVEDFINFVYSGAVDNRKSKENAVKMMSIHRSKGLEWDNVFVTGIEDGDFPDTRSDLEEEARLFYVATTRSKKNLYISEIGTGNTFVQEYSR